MSRDAEPDTLASTFSRLVYDHRSVRSCLPGTGIPAEHERAIVAGIRATLVVIAGCCLLSSSVLIWRLSRRT